MMPSCTTPGGERNGDEQIRRLAWQASQLDSAAFADLYRLYSPQVLRYVQSRIAARHDAEDLTHTIFEKALGAMSRYQPSPAQFSAWLFTIARNHVIDYYRKPKLPVQEMTGADMQTVDEADGPEARMIADERRRRLHRAVLGLTAEQRQVIGCRFFFGLSVAEVAQMMGKTEGAIKALQFRGLSRLQRELAPEWPHT